MTVLKIKHLPRHYHGFQKPLVPDKRIFAEQVSIYLREYGHLASTCQAHEKVAQSFGFKSYNSYVSFRENAKKLIEES